MLPARGGPSRLWFHFGTTLLVLASLVVCRGRNDSSLSPSAPSDGTSAPPISSSGDAVLNGDLLGARLYPTNNWWNRDISGAPVDPGSRAFMDRIGDDPLHPDFGPPPFGIPYIVVPGSQPRVPVTFVAYPDESDAGASGQPPGYPIPDEARTMPNYIEGGVPGGGDDGDRHLLVLDRDRMLLFETWATRYREASGWEAGSGAVFNLASNGRRPEGWTSADAAGLAILPGLVRYDEVFGGDEIRHAFRVTVQATNGHVWPASHTAGRTTGALPMGARLRLKRGVDISEFSEPIQRIFRAMKNYGLIVADNGSDMSVTGTMDERWNNDELNPAFGALRASDFEVIELGWR